MTITFDLAASNRYHNCHGLWHDPNLEFGSILQNLYQFLYEKQVTRGISVILFAQNNFKDFVINRNINCSWKS